MNRRIVANLATFFIVGGLFVYWAVTSLISVDALNKPYHLKADFSSSVGLLPGSEVDYLGVTYGTVGSVERIPGGVRVAVKMEHGKLVPRGASANIFRKSALGEQYIEFDPPPPPAGPTAARCGGRHRLQAQGRSGLRPEDPRAGDRRHHHPAQPRRPAHRADGGPDRLRQPLGHLRRRSHARLSGRPHRPR